MLRLTAVFCGCGVKQHQQERFRNLDPRTATAAATVAKVHVGGETRGAGLWQGQRFQPSVVSDDHPVGEYVVDYGATRQRGADGVGVLIPVVAVGDDRLRGDVLVTRGDSEQGEVE